MQTKAIFILVVAVCLRLQSSATGYAVGAALSLNELADASDVIFKGRVANTGKVVDPSFKPYTGVDAFETQFDVVSIIKGDFAGKAIRFRHYDSNIPPMGFMGYHPQMYHFEKGRSYIVFAKKSDVAEVLRQASEILTTKEDQIAMRCVDGNAAAGGTAKAVVWNELTAALKSSDAGDVNYALDQFAQLSDLHSGSQDNFVESHDFKSDDVLAAAHDLIHSSNPEIAGRAINMVGSYNPYLAAEQTIFWLATVGSAPDDGIGKMDPLFKNAQGQRYWRDLVTVADAVGPADTRALAIRALGLVREEGLKSPIRKWLRDPAAAVRASAGLLLADYSDLRTRDQISSLAGDAAALVRISAANAIGFSQQIDLVDLLEKLLSDKDATVRRAAAMNLLSFSSSDNSIAAIFRRHVGDAEFSPLFLNALARTDPQPYLDALCLAVQKKPEPQNWWGGKIPAFASWEILFKYLQSKPADEMRSGRLDRCLDAMEQVGNYSSSEPRDIYAFYLQRGMKDRARRFRAFADKSVPFDLEYYFKEVDQNPAAYTRE